MKNRPCLPTIFHKAYFILSLLICCLLLGSGSHAKAASPRAKALKAYQNLLSSKAALRKQGVNSRTPLNRLCFTTAYIDNDNVPELLVADREDYYLSLFTYRNGKVKCFNGFFFLGNDETFAYYKKKGVYRAINSYGDYSHCWNYYTLKKGRDKLFAVKTMRSNIKKKILGYQNASGKKISASRFRKLLKSKVGKRKSIVIMSNNYKKNTSANRKKYLK